MISVNIKKSIKNINDKYSMFISFKYDGNILSVIRSFPTRFYNGETHEWEVPIKRLKELTEKLPEQDFEITGEYVDLSPNKTAIPEGFEFKTKPFQHQLEGFEYGLNYDRWLLGDEQGLGKTKQVIDIAVAKKDLKGYKHCLILCCVNSLKWNWQQEIHTHSNEECWILGQRTRKNGTTVIGSTSDKIEDLKNIKKLPYFIITNIESIRNADILSELQKAIKAEEISMIAADEIHKCKNSTSQQGKALLKLQPECRIAMTGTPLMNTPIDLYIILKWLGYENHALYSFKKHYCIMGGFTGWEIVGYKHLDELQEQLNSIMLRRLKSDVLDLPEKIYIDEFVDLTPKQSVIYNEVTSEIKSNIDKIKSTNNPLSQLIRLRQATGYTGILSETIKESTKLDRMEDIVQEATANGKKVVIFTNWVQMVKPIQDRLQRYLPAIITGETPDNERTYEVNRFQSDNSCKVIIGTIGAMGTGLTLTAGTVEIFMDEPWTMANKQQAIDRCHRIGARQNVCIYTIMAKGTIDERIHSIVEKKGIMADALVDGKIAQNKSELIDYLIG